MVRSNNKKLCLPQFGFVLVACLLIFQIISKQFPMHDGPSMQALRIIAPILSIPLLILFPSLHLYFSK